MDNTISDGFEYDSDVQTPILKPVTTHEPRRRKSRFEKHLPPKYVIAAIPSANSLEVEVKIETTDTGSKHTTQALIDSGATGMFIDGEWARSNNIPTRKLEFPIPVFNVDGTPNAAGQISEVADIVLHFEDHYERVQLAVTQLGKQNIILGFTWLR
jgi:predicted aspartyl protease